MDYVQQSFLRHKGLFKPLASEDSEAIQGSAVSVTLMTPGSNVTSLLSVTLSVNRNILRATDAQYLYRHQNRLNDSVQAEQWRIESQGQRTRSTIINLQKKKEGNFYFYTFNRLYLYVPRIFCNANPYFSNFTNFHCSQFVINLKALITTAADDIHKYFFIVFQRK